MKISELANRCGARAGVTTGYLDTTEFFTSRVNTEVVSKADGADGPEGHSVRSEGHLVRSW